MLKNLRIKNKEIQDCITDFLNHGNRRSTRKFLKKFFLPCHSVHSVVRFFFYSCLLVFIRGSCTKNDEN